MSELGKTIVEKIGEKEVICRELSVDKIRQLLSETSPTDITSQALFPEMCLDDLPTFTNLTAADIGPLLPSQIAQVVDWCKEANPHFFDMLTRLQATAPKAG